MRNKTNWLTVIIWTVILAFIGVGGLVYIAEVHCQSIGIN